MQNVIRASQARRKPSFLFVGPGRAGSNWFTEILREHPGVFVPPNRGTFFFSKHYHMGIGWYERFFTQAGDAVAGEVCEDYLSTPEALVRIREYNPEMRLICCLRNPYERAISSWRFFARNGHSESRLAVQADHSPHVFECGYYATQLRDALSLFGRDRIMVLLFEELTLDPRSVVRRLYDFINVDPDFAPASLYTRVNGNSRARFPPLARLIHDIHIRSWGTSRVASNAVGWVKRFQPLRRLLRGILYYDHRPTTDWRDYIAEFPEETIDRYEQEITDLETMLDWDLCAWRAFPVTDSASRSIAGSSRP